MATFSPSPAPRRSSRLQHIGPSPSRIQRPHRLAATPSFINDSASVTSAMDIDDRASIMTDRSLSRIGGDVIFAKTDEISVSIYANLPLEVKQVLRTSGASAYPKMPLSFLIDYIRFQQRSILWRNRHSDRIRACNFRADVFCVATRSGVLCFLCSFRSDSNWLAQGNKGNTNVLHLFVSSGYEVASATVSHTCSPGLYARTWTNSCLSRWSDQVLG